MAWAAASRDAAGTRCRLSDKLVNYGALTLLSFRESQKFSDRGPRLAMKFRKGLRGRMTERDSESVTRRLTRTCCFEKTENVHEEGCLRGAFLNTAETAMFELTQKAETQVSAFLR
jgi:hypothetical protein